MEMGRFRVRVTCNFFPEPVKLSRNRLKSVMGECRTLLKALGFECVSSTGEAEALCAQVRIPALKIFTLDSNL